MTPIFFALPGLTKEGAAGQPCPAGSTAVAGTSICAPCPAGTSSLAGGLCTPCPAGQTSHMGGLCFSCNNVLLPNGDFSAGVLGTSSITCVPPILSFSRSRQAVLSDQGWGEGDQKLPTLCHYPLPNQHPLLGCNECDASICRRSWTVLNQAGGIGNWFLTNGGPSASGSGKVDPAGINGQYAVTGQIGPGAHALISTAHLVAPGETLSLNFFANNVISFEFNDTMSFNAFNNQQAGQCFVAGPVQPAVPIYVLGTLLHTLSAQAPFISFLRRQASS